MPRILIAGFGYVGAATAGLFHDAGWGVEGWTASAESAERLAALPYLIRAVDLSDREAVARAESGFDAVLQCASSRGGGTEDYRRVYLEGARNLVAVFPESLLLFTSSTSVYAQTDGDWVTELSPAEPDRETGRILREAEEVVLARGGVVARLAGIFGPGRSALLRKFLAGEAVLDPTSERFVNQAHRDDIASALLLSIQKHLELRPPEIGVTTQIYNVADGNPLRQRECYEWLARHLNRPLPPFQGVPPKRKRGDSNKRVSSARLQALGWRPRYPTFAAAMTESILPHAGL